ncbi:MAG: hypothetical protein ACKOPO_01415 [Novosphingobium sp.]
MLKSACLAVLAGLVVSTGPAFAVQTCPGFRGGRPGTADEPASLSQDCCGLPVPGK